MPNELWGLLLGAGLNLLIAIIIIRFIYYPASPNKSYVFSFLAFNTVIYFVMGLLTSIEIGIGVGFGLFAIFSVLRYRTDEMPIREMTYLFVIIALPIMNSVLMPNGDYLQLLVTNAFVVAVLFVLEREWGFYFQASKRITYEKIELITPANYEQLLADLRLRTGLPITRAEVERINFLRDTAELTVFYDEPKTLASPAKPTTLAPDYRARKQPLEP